MKEQERYGYVKLSNAFWRNGKTMTLLRVNPLAIAYYTLLLAYCSDNLTDGVIPDIAIRGVFAIPDEVMDLLVEVHLVDKLGESFRIHDYLKWNLSGSEIEQERAVRREQARKRKQKQRDKEAAESDKSDESVSVTPMSRSSHASVTQRHAQLRTKNLELRTNIPSFPKPLPSQVPLDQYEPPEDLKKEMMQECKISAAAFALLEEGFRGWWSEQDEQEKTRGQWDRLLKGWIRKSKNRPEYQVHKHTWACSHTLHALGVTSTAELNAQFEEPTRGNQLAQQVATYLNRGESEDEAVTRAQEQMFD
ncbi:hypothetical protein [Aeriscardovia aeriphila]|uniref:Uncharacterized protein n=1 Tax=Aeriscardovia aeriphila TaxID=218139 RepID=A0A261FA74_9BIFI|nr:hypothetical protein [Aeriscardovia aeriphila]NYI25800.1 hypothetical protein [Aeriscardovia aeriphila]OZG56050.1 hypothetical protein AEAE_0538 [Aeriscardovia aeriphila]